MSRKLWALVAIALLVAAPARAEDAAEKGERIARQSAENGRGYVDSQVSGEMVLSSADGRTSQRKFYLKMLEGSGKSNSSLLVFQWPGDIQNTGLLTQSSSSGSDNQWLYLPSISRVKRISSTGRSGAFVGSEFAYEDMVDQDVGKFTYQWLETGACPGGGSCEIIDRFPKFNSGYSKQRIWIDTDKNRLMKVEYYDRGGSLLKTLTISGYRLYEGKFWRADQFQMSNHLTGKKTSLTWKNFRFNTGITPNDVSVNALNRL